MNDTPKSSSAASGELFPDEVVSSPRRRAAKKAVAKKTVAKKAPAKKAAVKKTVPVVEIPVVVEPPAAPAKKKRATAKAVAPVPEPVAVPPPAAAPAKPGRKPRAIAAPAPEPMVSEPIKEVPAPAAKKKAVRKSAGKPMEDNREPELPVAAPVEPPAASVSEPGGTEAPPAERERQNERPRGRFERDRRDQRPPLEPRQDKRPQDSRRPDDNRPPGDREYDSRPERPPHPRDRQEGPPPQGGEAGGNRLQDIPLGPDGQPRRLTKWERWKLRKEKFKLLKQQRYLERTGRAPGGPNGGNEGANGDRPERPERGERPDRPDRQERPERGERQPRPEPVLGPPEDCAGLLEITGKGFAFLRPAERGFEAQPTDPFVSQELIRNFGLREGVMVDAVMRRGGRGPQVVEIRSVNGLPPETYRTLPLFEELTAINPNKRYMLETVSTRHTTRLIDFIAPIGRGQRGLIVAPPRAGKTTFLQHIAEAMLENYDEVKVMVVLVDERPEEVTEISRAVPGAEIMASSNDQDPRNHIRMAHLAIERAKRLVEAGQHVFIVLDSITRLARAFNGAIRGGGKAMSGGVDSRALEGPRKLFAAARNTREAGSLTIVATALVETNNKGDDLVFQEFKGTGNMELVLDRKIAQQYVYPAVDIFKSGTRREELLLSGHQLDKVHLIRRGLSGHKPVEAVERLMHFMKRFPSNAQMLLEIKQRE